MAEHPETAAVRRTIELIPDRVQTGRGIYGTSSVESNPLVNLRNLREELADAWAYLDWAEQWLLPREGRLRVYIAGPYQNGGGTVEENVQPARECLWDILRAGHTPFCPHTMTSGGETVRPPIHRDVFLQTDLDWLPFCHLLIALPGYLHSQGSVDEVNSAGLLDLPWREWPCDLPTPEEVARATESGWPALRELLLDWQGAE